MNRVFSLLQDRGFVRCADSRTVLGAFALGIGGSVFAIDNPDDRGIGGCPAGPLDIFQQRRFVVGDINSAIVFTRHAASMAAQSHGQVFSNLGPNKTALVLREPVGVVGVIVPWNFPIEILAKKVPFALASGCTVVVKPSEMTSGTALEYARLAAEAGLPPGVLNIVTGRGPEVGEAIVRHPSVNMVSFTGSSAIGKRIIEASAETTKRVTLELGGKSANIVFNDANLDDALRGTLKAIFAFQGQCCVAGSRLLLQEDVADAFVERLVAHAEQLKMGDPTSSETDLGSMISAAHTERVMGYVDRAGSCNQPLVGGGRVTPTSGLTANFVTPTIFDNVGTDSELFTDEVFGPVLAISRFKTMDEAIALANSTRYGLANSVWTASLATSMNCAHRLQSGMVWVNTTLDGAPQLPFGGTKASGFGRELGEAGFVDFTEHKTVILATGRHGSAFPGVGA
jgi:acyl-CoA reductase-like NAD-dependent aldehyde dehydrogenase